MDDQLSGRRVAMATGSRTEDAQWRVHRVEQQVRSFESIANSGSFLRILSDGKVDVMVRFNVVVLVERIFLYGYSIF